MTRVYVMLSIVGWVWFAVLLGYCFVSSRKPRQHR